MTNEEIFEILITWASTFGCDVIGANEEAFPEERKKSRGFFRVVKRGPGTEEEIWFKDDLPLEERVEVLAHEVGHMALFLLKVEPCQEKTHQVTADVFGKSLIALFLGDSENPLLKVTGIIDLIKEFLEILKQKKDRTSLNLARMNAAHLQWKKEQEGSGKAEGGIGVGPLNSRP